LSATPTHPPTTQIAAIPTNFFNSVTAIFQLCKKRCTLTCIGDAISVRFMQVRSRLIQAADTHRR
jgi:hypothetical protein